MGPHGALGQQGAMPVVGFLHVGSRNAFGHVAEAVRRGLAEVDFVEGRNVTIEYRWAEGQLDRLPALVADLMRRQMAVFVANTPAIQAAKLAGATMPFVFVSGEDPVKLGFVESLNRPGGNMTGVYLLSTGLEAKRLGLLHDVVRKATTIAVLIDLSYPTADIQLRDVQSAAARLGLKLVVLHASSARDFEGAFVVAVQQQAAALLVCASVYFNNNRDQLVALAARHAMPAAYEWREYAEVGGLLSYGHSLTEMYRQTGIYAGRILKGAKPADLPVVQPAKFEFVINAKTAKTLGIDITDNVLMLADQIIE
jgi:putative ABC transport system substrate-binding protein